MAGPLAGRGLPSRLRPSASRLRHVEPGDGGDRDRSKNWYGTARWQRLRKWVLLRDGFVCRQTGVVLCEGRRAPNAAVVDHIRPHRGDPRLFWDPDNLQAVSKAWHDSTKQSLEKTGRA